MVFLCSLMREVKRLFIQNRAIWHGQNGGGQGPKEAWEPRGWGGFSVGGEGGDVDL